MSVPTTDEEARQRGFESFAVWNNHVAAGVAHQKRQDAELRDKLRTKYNVPPEFMDIAVEVYYEGYEG